MKDDSHKIVACLNNWDTIEPVDGYTIEELLNLREMLNDTIHKMRNLDYPGQLYLF